MTGSQGILLSLVALTTWIGFIEAQSRPHYRVTLPRFVIALIAPCFWAALILFLPLESWVATPKNPTFLYEIFNRFVFFPLVVILVMSAPIWFIGSILVWVGGALCGLLKDELRNLLLRFRKKS